jgi:hypothetical protein
MRDSGDPLNGKVIDFQVLVRAVGARPGTAKGSSQPLERTAFLMIAERLRSDPRYREIIHDQDAGIAKLLRDLQWNLIEHLDPNHVLKSCFNRHFHDCNAVAVINPSTRREVYALSSIEAKLLKHLRWFMKTTFEDPAESERSWMDPLEHLTREESKWPLKTVPQAVAQLERLLRLMWQELPTVLDEIFNANSNESLCADKARFAPKMICFGGSFAPRASLVVVKRNLGPRWFITTRDQLGFAPPAAVVDRVLEAHARSLAWEQEISHLPGAAAKRTQGRQAKRARREAETAAGPSGGHVPPLRTGAVNPGTPASLGAALALVQRGLAGPVDPPMTPSAAMLLDTWQRVDAVSDQLNFGGLNAGVRSIPPIHCHFIAIGHAILPIIAVRNAFRAARGTPIARLFRQLADDRRRAAISLVRWEQEITEVTLWEQSFIEVLGTGEERPWFSDIRDARETFERLLTAAILFGHPAIAQLFEVRCECFRVPVAAGCRAPPERVYTDTNPHVTGVPSCRLRHPEDVSGWPAFNLDHAFCPACECVHGWQKTFVLGLAPAVWVFDVAGRFGYECCVPLTFQMTQAATDGGPSLRYRYELPSFVRSLPDQLQFVAVVRTGQTPLDARLYDDRVVDVPVLWPASQRRVWCAMRCEWRSAGESGHYWTRSEAKSACRMRSSWAEGRARPQGLSRLGC